MEYTIKKLGELAGISTRTLRYYDEIGLLKPSRINSSGYRIYGEKEVDMLQQILFYREFGLGLEQIAKMLQEETLDRKQALKEHLHVLLEERCRLDCLIENLNKTIQKEEGKITMSDKEKFEGFKKKIVQENEEKYGAEIREKYGDDTVNKSNAKMMHLTEEAYEKMTAIGEEILKRLEVAVQAGADPTEEEGQQIASLHKEWLQYTWPTYSKEAHAGLVQMYVDDERFTKYYDKNVEGCAIFLRDAVNALL